MKILPILIALLLTLPATAQNKRQRRAADRLFEHYNTTNTSGISVLIIRNGKKIYDRSFGLAHIESGRKTSAVTNYRIASVTKMFTAMSILMLRDEEKLSLDDPLTKFFPATTPFGEKITVKQLLNHTSGIVSYGSLLPGPVTSPLTGPDVLRLVESQDTTRFPPGSRFDYSNTGYVLLGLIVEKASGLPFPDFLHRRIFLPLGMQHSTVNDPEGDIPHRAFGYNLENGKLVPKDQSPFSYLQGDGGIYSSTAAFYHWDQALYTTRLVTTTSLVEMFTPSSRPTPTLGYGYGWEIEKKYGLVRQSHSGGSSGFSSYYVRFPEKKFSIVIFANQNNGVALGPVAEALEQIFLPEAY